MVSLWRRERRVGGNGRQRDSTGRDERITWCSVSDQDCSNKMNSLPGSLRVLCTNPHSATIICKSGTDFQQSCIYTA